MSPKVSISKPKHSTLASVGPGRCLKVASGGENVLVGIPPSKWTFFQHQAKIRTHPQSVLHKVAILESHRAGVTLWREVRVCTCGNHMKTYTFPLLWFAFWVSILLKRKCFKMFQMEFELCKCFWVTSTISICWKKRLSRQFITDPNGGGCS